MWEWSSQQVVTHHLRHLMSRASLGSDVFFTNIHQGPFSRDLERQLTVFYDMLDRGVLHVPARDELLSVSDVCLGMRSPPSELLIAHGTNGHRYRFRSDDHSPLVFDRLDTYWGGASLVDHDFSQYALGVRRRMTNYLPIAPYGMVTIVPDDTDMTRHARLVTKFSTDGQFFFDPDGRPHDPAEYAPVVEQAIREAAQRLPIRVQGDVHWSVVRLDATHIRVTLIDPGYVDPADREAEVVLQHLVGRSCTDILSGETIPIKAGVVRVTIPAGVLRILDIAHQ